MRYEKLLAKRYIKAQKLQSVFTVISIAAAVAVMTMFFLLYSVFMDCARTVEYNNEPYHLLFRDITAQQGEELQNIEHVELVKLEQESDSSVTAYVMFKDNFGDKTEWAQTTASKLGISGQPVCEWNDELLFLDNIDDTAHLHRLQLFSFIFVFILAFAFALRMVIDTAFEVSSKERERHYGVLQSVGATPEQIVKIITSEAIRLCIIGIPVGLVMGIGFAYGMYKAVLNNGLLKIFETISSSEVKLLLPFRIDPLMLILAGATGIAWVFFSAYGVGMRIIKKSPIEAITTRANNVEKVKKHPLLGIFFGVSGRMASRNAKRQKKRFVITVLTLTISITLFGCCTSVSDYLRNFFENFMNLDPIYCDFEVDVDKDKLDILEKSGLFKDIGISDIKFVKFSEKANESSLIEYVNKTAYEQITGGKTNVSYEELVETDGYIVNPGGFDYGKDDSLLEKLENSVGKDIECYAIKKTIDDKNNKTADDMERTAAAKSETVKVKVHISGVVPDAKASIMSIHGLLIAPIENVDSWGENVGSFFVGKTRLTCTCSVINISKYKDAIAFFENNTSCIEMRADWYAERVKGTSEMSAITAGVLFINVLIGIIAVINLLNIVSTGIANRRSELASLQCIGMTSGQLDRMAALECLQYTISSAVISLVLCSLILLGLDSAQKLVFSENIMSQTEAEMFRKIIPKMDYATAYIRIVAASLAAFLTACAASVIMLRHQNTDSLTEQIRGTEMHISTKESHILRNSVIAVVGAIVIAIAGLRIYSKASYLSDRKVYKNAGYLNLVDAGDIKMNVYITGAENGKHTIVGLAGQGSECFPVAAKEMTEILGKENTVVYPDRAGNGFSEDSRKPQTIECVVENYREGLKNAGVNAPYVLMGHSYGGMYAAYWQLKYPDEVEAVVFLDGYILPKNECWMAYESEDKSISATYRSAIAKHWLGLDRLAGNDSTDPMGTALFSSDNMKLIKMLQRGGTGYEIGTFAYTSECMLMKEQDSLMNEMLEPTDIPKLYISAAFTCEEDIREYYEFMKADYEAAGKEFEKEPSELARSEWMQSYWEYQNIYLDDIEPFIKRLGNCKCRAIPGEHALFYAQKPQETADAVLDFIS